MKKSFLVFLPVLLSAGCFAPLPEAETPAAMLYADRCGTCHRPHHPGGLTPKMWETMIRRMEGEMDRRGMRGLSPEERTTILEYLTRHAYAE